MNRVFVVAFTFSSWSTLLVVHSTPSGRPAAIQANTDGRSHGHGKARMGHTLCCTQMWRVHGFLLLFPAEVIRSPGRGRKDWQYYQGPGKKLIMLQSAPSAGRVGLAPGRGPLSARRLPKVFALSCSFASIAVICHG
jgi:hypothetical protein